MNKRQDVIAYLRTATDDEAGIIRQQRLIQEFCNAENLDLIRTFSDLGVSGNDEERKGWKDLMTFITNGETKIHQVIVTDLARIGSDIEKVLRLSGELEASGVKITPMNDVQNVVMDLYKIIRSSPPSNKKPKSIKRRR